MWIYAETLAVDYDVCVLQVCCAVAVYGRVINWRTFVLWAFIFRLWPNQRWISLGTLSFLGNQSKLHNKRGRTTLEGIIVRPNVIIPRSTMFDVIILCSAMVKLYNLLKCFCGYTVKRWHSNILYYMCIHILYPKRIDCDWSDWQIPISHTIDSNNPYSLSSIVSLHPIANAQLTCIHNSHTCTKLIFYVYGKDAGVNGT